VVTAVAAAELEEGAFVVVEGAVVPGEMRRRRIESRGQHGHESAVVAPVAASAEHGLLLDLGHQHVLGEARLDQFEDPGMHGIDDGGGAADEVDLVVALDGALPVDQPGRVEERGIGEVPAQ
jgi:hypothetical protein